jgi:hypothetical protein
MKDNRRRSLTVFSITALVLSKKSMFDPLAFFNDNEFAFFFPLSLEKDLINGAFPLGFFVLG